MGPAGQTGSRLGMGPQDKLFSQLGICLQEKQLLLSEARTSAACGGEVKTGEEELLLMQELR